jgi:hypothetical protein
MHICLMNDYASSISFLFHLLRVYGDILLSTLHLQRKASVSSTSGFPQSHSAFTENRIVDTPILSLPTLRY